MRIMLFLYNAAALIVLPAIWPYFFLRRLMRGKPMPDLRKRMGWELPPSPVKTGGAIWIHAVSVGEAQVVAPLIAALEQTQPTMELYVSTTTPTGQETARKLFIGRAHIFYCPFDLPGPVKRVLDRLQPHRIIIAETELWPNLLVNAWRRGIPVTIVNGRISDRSLPRYRLVRQAFAPFLALPTNILAQTESDARRFIEVGAPVERVIVTGNMKFDAIREIRSDQSLMSAIQGLFGPETPEILLCGSTTEGEEAMLAEMFISMRRQRPKLRLVVAPRHPERFPAAATEFAQRGLAVYLRSRLEEGCPPKAPDVVILDTIGELAGLYPLADVVFVGGSLVPKGGHNILEPALAGKPVVVGPSMDNFREITALFRQGNALVQVPDPAAMERAILELLANRPMCRELGERAQHLVRQHQGATQRNMESIFAQDGG